MKQIERIYRRLGKTRKQTQELVALEERNLKLAVIAFLISSGEGVREQARRLGVSPSYIGGIRLGQRRITNEFIDRLRSGEAKRAGVKRSRSKASGG